MKAVRNGSATFFDLKIGAQRQMKKIYAYSNRGQGIIIVLFALRELAGSCSKQEVIKFIQDRELYEITRHDLPPYDGQNEPNYHTLLAWARKDALDKDWLIQTNERDNWLLSRRGRAVLERAIESYRSGELKIQKCYLWTPLFKKQIEPAYVPSKEDAVRPDDVLLYD